MLTVTEFAARLSVNRKTIHRYIKQGKIGCIRLPSGHIRIPEKEIERLMGIDKTKEGS